MTFTVQLPAGTTIDDRAPAIERYVIRDAAGELLIIDSAFSKLEPITLSDVPLTEVTLNGTRAMQHERRANKVAAREVIIKGAVFLAGNGPGPEAASYTRVRYQNLPDARARVADEIIETLQPLDWR